MKIKRLIAKGLRTLLQPPALTKSELHPSSRVCSGSQINYSSIDRYSYVGHDCFVLDATIGPFCSIADNCRIGGANHPVNRVSTSPVFHEGKNVLKTNISNFPQMKGKGVSVGADVWIGAGATILSGVHIGNGAVIGAGSVVTHDVPNYEIWAGNPAKKIRNRFDEVVINQLLEIQWWNYSEQKLEKYAEYFDDVELFIRKVRDEDITCR